MGNIIGPDAPLPWAFPSNRNREPYPESATAVWFTRGARGAVGLNVPRGDFAQDNVAVVERHQKVVAIVTEVDLIELLAQRMG